VVSRVRVAQSGQHVCDRICHCHCDFSFVHQVSFSRYTTDDLWWKWAGQGGRPTKREAY